MYIYYYSLGTGRSFAGVKAAGAWGLQPFPSSCEVKNEKRRISAPPPTPYVFVGCTDPASLTVQTIVGCCCCSHILCNELNVCLSWTDNSVLYDQRTDFSKAFFTFKKLRLWVRHETTHCGVQTYLMSPNTCPGSALCKKRSRRPILLSMYAGRQPAAHCAVLLRDQSDVVWCSGCPKVVFYESAVVAGLLCEVRKTACFGDHVRSFVNPFFFFVTYYRGSSNQIFMKFGTWVLSKICLASWVSWKEFQ